MESRQKILGQYFSGDLIPSILKCLLVEGPYEHVIDPMAGAGDMLRPFMPSSQCYAVEIDPEAYKQLNNLIPNSICDNSFSYTAMSAYRDAGYDVVITNPPYIRRELLEESNSLPNYCSVQQIISNLKEYANRSKVYSKEEINRFVNVIESLPSNSDLAAYSWLLCMLLTSRLGQMAMVVPNSWMTREYAKPVMALFCELFSVRFVVNDVSSSFFEGKAQVRTCLIVAKRKNVSASSEDVVVADICRKAFEIPLSAEQLCYYILKQKEEQEIVEIHCETREQFQARFSNKHVFINRTLKEYIDEEVELNTLDELGVVISQGFRSGANSFFYYQQQGDYVTNAFGDIMPFNVVSPFLLPAIQCQQDLKDGSEGGKKRYVLFIHNACLNRDHKKATEYKILPSELSQTILKTENREVRGKKVPSLSAVCTNIKQDKVKKCSRFWYMLPEMRPRHYSELFFPRVNTGRVICYRNPGKFVIDANFLTIQLKDDSVLTASATYALLNSTWSSVLFEKLGTVMGGGALKIDAVQLKDFLVPKLSGDNLKELDLLGQHLLTSGSDSPDIISSIDDIMLSSVSSKHRDLAKVSLQKILNKFLENRQKHGSE